MLANSEQTNIWYLLVTAAEEYSDSGAEEE